MGDKQKLHGLSLWIKFKIYTVHFVHFRNFHKMYIVPKMYKIYSNAYELTNPHNQFFFFRLCEFALSPYCLFSRTFYVHILSHPWKSVELYFADFLRLQSRQSIWQLEAMVRPPSTHGVIWSASICSISKCLPQSGHMPSCFS